MSNNPEYVSVPVGYEEGHTPGYVRRDFRYDWIYPPEGDPEKVFIVNPDLSQFDERTIRDIGGVFRPYDEETKKPPELELTLGKYVKLVR